MVITTSTKIDNLTFAAINIAEAKKNLDKPLLRRCCYWTLDTYGSIMHFSTRLSSSLFESTAVALDSTCLELLIPQT